MKKLYVIAGPNGAGKTTLSYTILPEVFNCKEFVNADEIAKGLSPFNPEKMAIRAGRLMLDRINDLISLGESFAYETTLSTRSYVRLIETAQSQNYEIILLFLFLDSVALAKRRVAVRVKEGGHNIPDDIISRRYNNGLKNLFQLYMPIVDKWILVDNSSEKFEFIAEGVKGEIVVKSENKWTTLKNKIL